MGTGASLDAGSDAPLGPRRRNHEAPAKTAPPPAPDTVLEPVGPRKRWTTAEFDRLLDDGYLREGSDAYLWDFEIIEPKSEHPPHIHALANLYRSLILRLPEDAWTVSQAAPVELRDGYKPQPDLSVLRGPRAGHWVRAPGPAVVALLVEVSNISYPKDSVPFLREYASAGVAQYWIVNIPDRRVEVYRDPSGPAAGAPSVRPPGRLRPRRCRCPWNWSVTACSPASGVSPWTTSSAILEPRAGTTGGQDVVLPEVRGDPTVPVGGRSRPRGPRSSSARPRKNQALPVPERHGRRPGARPGRRKPDDVPVAASEWPQIIKVLIET